MLQMILNFIGGGIVGQIAKPLLEAHKAKLNAQNEEDRLAADISIQQLQAQMHSVQAAKEVRQSTAMFLEMRVLTFFAAAPFILHSGAVGLDTVFQLGWAIPAYPPPFDEYQGQILMSFFGLAGGVTAVRGLAWAIARRR